MAEFEGLYVKFGANTIEFDNSVKGMNKALTLLKKDLQSLNKQLRLDPKNIDLVNKKMRNLQQQAELGQKKIEELRKQQKALGEDKIGTAKWQELESEIQKTEAQMQVVQRAIAATDKQLRSLTPGNIEYVNRQLDEMAAKAEKAADKVGKIKDGFEKAGNAAKPFSAAAGAGLIAGAKAAGDLQEQMAKTEAVFKTSSKVVDEFAVNSIENINLAENTSRTLANTYGAMGSGLGLAEKENTKLAMSITSMTADMSAFNDVSVDRAQTALKSIYTGETESLKEMGIVMTQANLEQFAQNKGISKKIKDMTEAEKVQLRYNFVQEAMADALGAAKREQDSFNGQLRLFKEQIIEIATNIGKVLMPVLEPMLKSINEFVKRIAELDDTQMKKVVKGMVALAALAPALLGVAKILGIVEGALKGMSKAFLFLKDTKLVGMIAKIFGGISSGVILAIAAAVVAVGVALKQLWDRSEKFRKTISGLFGSIGGEFQVIFNMLKANFGSLKSTWETVWSYIEPAWLLFQEIVGVAAVAILSAIETIIGVFRGLATVLVGVFTGNNDLVKAGFDTMLGFLKQFVINIKTYISSVDWGGLAKTAINGVVKGALALGEFLWNTFILLFNTVVDLIKNIDWYALGTTVLTVIINGIKAIARFLWDGVKTIFNTAMDTIKKIDWYSVGSLLMNLIIKAISAIGSMVWNTLKSIFTSAKNNSTSSIDWASVGRTLINMIVSAIGAIGGAIWNALKGALNAALNSAKTIDWSSVGRSIVNGIVSGVAGLGSALVSKVNSAISSAKAAAGNLWNKITGGGRSFSMDANYGNMPQLMQRMADVQMNYYGSNPAAQGHSINVTVDARGDGAADIARKIERAIVRGIQS